jgi:hypothetical protein
MTRAIVFLGAVTLFSSAQVEVGFVEEEIIVRADYVGLSSAASRFDQADGELVAWYGGSDGIAHVVWKSSESLEVVGDDGKPLDAQFVGVLSDAEINAARAELAALGLIRLGSGIGFPAASAAHALVNAGCLAGGSSKWKNWADSDAIDLHGVFFNGPAVATGWEQQPCHI